MDAGSLYGLLIAFSKIGINSYEDALPTHTQQTPRRPRDPGGLPDRFFLPTKSPTNADAMARRRTRFAGAGRGR